MHDQYIHHLMRYLIHLLGLTIFLIFILSVSGCGSDSGSSSSEDCGEVIQINSESTLGIDGELKSGDCLFEEHFTGSLDIVESVPPWIIEPNWGFKHFDEYKFTLDSSKTVTVHMATSNIFAPHIYPFVALLKRDESCSASVCRTSDILEFNYGILETEIIAENLPKGTYIIVASTVTFEEDKYQISVYGLD